MPEEIAKLIDTLIMGTILNVSFTPKKNLFSKQTSLIQILILGIDSTYNSDHVLCQPLLTDIAINGF